MRALRVAVLLVAGCAAPGLVAGCTAPGPPPLGNEAPPPARTLPPPARVPSAGSAPVADAPAASAAPEPPEDPAVVKARVVAELEGRQPRAWGTAIPGVITSVPAAAGESVLALTFDACGGPGGDGYDAALVETLRRERVAATLFVTSRWIAANRAAAEALAREPLFEIENHGSRHRPCSVTGRSAFDIRGTRSVGDAVDEIQRGASAIAQLTGKAPRFYRPGTAYFDDVCLDVAAALGHAAAGFAVNGDGGTGFSRAQVKEALVKAKSGSIVLLHMNHPGGQTAEGVGDALPVLRARGVKLVRLGDVIPR